jgi:hypothetical protein
MREVSFWFCFVAIFFDLEAQLLEAQLIFELPLVLDLLFLASRQWRA